MDEQDARLPIGVQVYSQLISITNRSNLSVEASIRPSSSDRYSVHPKQLKLKGGQTAEVEIRLKLTRFAQTEKAVHHGHRDAIHIKTPHFADQQFYVFFFLDPSHLLPIAKGSKQRTPPNSMEPSHKHVNERVGHYETHGILTSPVRFERRTDH